MFAKQLQSSKKEDKLGCFTALNKILRLSRETTIIHYVNKILPIMRQQMVTNDNGLVEKGAECLGNLAEMGGATTASANDETLTQAIKWLRDDTSSKSTKIEKYSAVLIFKEYSRKLPVITFNKLFDGNYYQLIFMACKDHRENVRMTAAECINNCIKQLTDRSQRKGQQNQTQLIYIEVEKALKSDGDMNYQHSALSILAAIIQARDISKDILKQRGSFIINRVMELLKTSRSNLVRKKCIELIPEMFKNIPDYYRQQKDLLSNTLASIFDFINKKDNKDRGQGFVSLGKMSAQVEPRMFERYLEPILSLLQKELVPPPASEKNRAKPCVELHTLTCLRYLLKNFGSHIAKKLNMYELINKVFYSGYNHQVIACLDEISRICNGQYKRATQIKLLNSLSIILTQQVNGFPYNLEESFIARDPEQESSNRATLTSESEGLRESEVSFADGGQKSSGSMIGSSSTRGSSLKDFYLMVLDKDNQHFLDEMTKNLHRLTQQKDQTAEQDLTKMITLAIKTLANYDFAQFSMCIVYFIEQTVIYYLDDDNPQVRKEAMQTCCSLSFPQHHARIGLSMERIVNKLLHRFFVTATTDQEDRIRVTMLKYLNPQFYPFINRYENILMLFNCMQDQNFEIKEHTVWILGQLVPHNASQILPYLRQLIVSLISQLELSNDSKEREEAVKLIKTFVRACPPDLTCAYSSSILTCLIKKLDGELATSAFVSAVLEVISEIAKVNSEDIKPYLGDLFPLVLECIKDLSSRDKRQMAIKTLISIIENTGFVVKPYFYFPQILKMITSLVQNEEQKDIRKLVFRLIGTLGAIDPYVVKQVNQENIDREDDTEILQSLRQLLGSDENDDGMKKIRQVQGTRNQQIATAVTINTGSKAVELVSIDSLDISKENKYPAMAINMMLKVLINPNLRDHHLIVISNIKYIIGKLAKDILPFLPLMIPPLIALIKQNDSTLSKGLFECINSCMQAVPESLADFSDQIFDMVHHMMQPQPVNVLVFMNTLSNYCPKNIVSQYAYLILPDVLNLIEQAKLEVKEIAMFTLQEFDLQLLDDHLYLIVPLLLRTIQAGDANYAIIEFNKIVIVTINKLVYCPTFREHTAQVVHQLLRVLALPSSERETTLIGAIIHSFITIAEELTSDFAPYISLIQKALRRNRLEDLSKAFEVEVLSITKMDAIEQFKYNLMRPPTSQMNQQVGESSFGTNALVRERETNKISLEQHKRHIVDTEVLLKEFDVSKCHVPDDWQDWLKKTSHQLLKQNPSPILYACSTLTEVYAPLATELYNIAFVICWKNLADREKQEILDNFLKAKNARTRPPRAVLLTILNLAEFIELDECYCFELKIFEAKTLANVAERCNAYAKALYYWEQEFEQVPTDTIEQLIQTNFGLNQPEAAEGILQYARNTLLIDDREEWYEKLQQWDNALRKYQKKLYGEPKNIKIKRGMLNCYRNMMDWSQMSKLVEEMWSDHLVCVDVNEKSQLKKEIKDIAPQAAYSFWNLNNWENFKKYVKCLDPQLHPYDRYFYQAVLEIKNGKEKLARENIDKARENLDAKVTTMISESYNRAYSLIQELQFLKELEEVIEYKKSSTSEKKKETLYKSWCQRMKAIPNNDLEAQQKHLNIRSLVIDQSEEIDSYIHFAKMAKELGNRKLNSTVLQRLKRELQQKLNAVNEMQGSDSQFRNNTQILEKKNKLNNQIVKVKIEIDDSIQQEGKKEGYILAIQDLKAIINKFDTGGSMIEDALLSQTYQKLAAWTFEMKSTTQDERLDDKSYEEILGQIKKATEINSQNYEAWHHYSQINYEASLYYSNKFSKQTEDKISVLVKLGYIHNKSNTSVRLHKEFGFKFLPQMLQKRFVNELADARGTAEKYVSHVVSTIRGLIQQLYLSSQVNHNITKTLQLVLRLLKLWFQHGNLPDIEKLLRDGLRKIDLKIWIEVIPQLLARIDIKDEVIKSTLLEFIEKISLKFPQALIYSLSVTQKSQALSRKEAANSLIEKLRTTQPILIEQATMISNELNRSAILLPEVWQEAIEEASRIYFGRNDGKAMFNYLEPLHKAMEVEPETMNEIAFYQGYAADLLEAFEWMKRFMQTNATQDINQAWDIYYSIFRNISALQKQVEFYELRNVAPKLMSTPNLLIAVPGTFQCNKPIVKIDKFASHIPVLSSKQHPRRMKIFGGDGREYHFLLKGHEDIRQDERVMQLFGLVNTLLSIDSQTAKKDLSIRRYPVIPLSQNTGLIGWVSNSDTLHQLIKDYRVEAGIIENIEFKLVNEMCEHFATCPLVNKVEIFRNALEKTVGEDIQKVLWVKSSNSEIWLERRTSYTRSLAVMSMVGYILGLGDRHPSNIMLERHTGKIVHIDFGDCFEIAMRREKFPERIPFRLTRMLTKAMEVSGIEGNFRTTCENTIRVMRDSRESLLAIMEAFVYDPLISFRLLNPKMLQQMKDEEQAKKKQLEEQKNKDKKQQSTVKEQDSADKVLAQIEINKKNQIREQIIETVIDKLQGPQGKNTFVNKSLAESKFSRRAEDMELLQLMNDDEDAQREKEMNSVAEFVIQRILEKLKGCEVINAVKMTQVENQRSENNQRKAISVEHQVDQLIMEAISHENLASCYIGWCPYW